MSRRLLLTGASSEIGHALAREAVASGWDVALCAHRGADATARLAAELSAARSGARCRAFSFDLRDSAETAAGVDAAVAFLGGIDAAALAHGLTHTTLLAELEDGEWQAVLDVNLSGSFRVARALLPEFVTARSGAFVFISSTAAYGLAGAAAYAASKAALHGLSATIALEYGERGIRSNAIACGALSSGMFVRANDAAARAAAAGRSALGRLGEPHELAKATLFLLSDDAKYINGQVLDFDGGRR